MNQLSVRKGNVIGIIQHISLELVIHKAFLVALGQTFDCQHLKMFLATEYIQAIQKTMAVNGEGKSHSVHRDSPRQNVVTCYLGGLL